MKFVDDPKAVDEGLLVAIFTGDGRTESHVMKSLAKRHNGKRIFLLCSKLPFHFRLGTGISAVKVVKTFVKYGILRTLFLVDKEHVGEKQVDIEIDRVLKGFGVEVESTKLFQQPPENALITTGSVGCHKLTIYSIVLGKEKCLDEDISKLIELELKLKVEPEKKIIRKVLHDNRLDIESLVDKAQSRNLTEAFPGLTFILDEIEKKNFE